MLNGFAPLTLGKLYLFTPVEIQTQTFLWSKGCIYIVQNEMFQLINSVFWGSSHCTLHLPSKDNLCTGVESKEELQTFPAVLQFDK